MARKTNKHSTTPFLIIGMVLLIIQSCNLPQSPQTQPTTIIDTLLTQTQEIIAITETAAASNSSGSENTITPAPSPTPTQTTFPADTQAASTAGPAADNDLAQNAEPISFRQGGTSAFKRGNITSDQVPAFTISAAAGQTVIAGVSSSSHDVYLEIQDLQSGQHLLQNAAGQPDWSGILPDTGSYLITLHTANPNTDYFLRIEIPADIIFTTGDTSTTIDGYLEVHDDLYPSVMTRVRYLVHAAAGQQMAIDITSPNIDSLSLGIYGETDGQPYKRYEVKGVSGTLELPLTQGYFIDVYSTGGISTAFTLEISIQ